MTAEPKRTLIFQDVVELCIGQHDLPAPVCIQGIQFQGVHPEQNGPVTPRPPSDQDLSLAFFELANVPFVGYRLASHQQRNRKNENAIANAKEEAVAVTVTVQQDTNACGNHTGGIVWETSYLLLNYLLHDRRNHDTGRPRSTGRSTGRSSTKHKLGRVLEVGAGCGLLGLVLAASGWCRRVVLTETETVLPNLLANRDRNVTVNAFQANQSRQRQRQRRGHALVQKLDWLRFEDDAVHHLAPHSFDTIVGTDVVFTPSLVEPLLQTLRFMAHDTTVVYLCLQIRCEDSHQLLLSKAETHQWNLEDVSHELEAIPECTWGLAMDCHVLKLTRITVTKSNGGTIIQEKRKNNVNDTRCQPGSSKNKQRKKPKLT